jgi:alpha-amylase
MMRFLRFFLLLFIVQVNGLYAQTQVKKVVLQGFWWDYWNQNYPNAWSNYLTELSPRLRSLGIDAVWIPPSYKNESTGFVGYAPFDHYDLGDKYQKGGGGLSVRTRMGTKDELLRMVAVMHANGMEVIQDVVLNHVNGAGTNTGTGGRDPQSPFSIATENGFKNFRYVSYSTPLINETQNDYWTRNGRWPKNFTNFYPNAAANCTTGDICASFFGPDISYEANAFGRSSNIPTSGSVNVGGINRAYVNPNQTSNYMRNNARNWLMWMKKQTGVDGWRWDAVKHFPIYVQEDLTYNTKYVLPSWSAGGQSMLNIGEWIGSKADLDNYVTAVRSGSEEHTGTFDFSLRGYGANGGLYSMVLSQGGYNMQNLPAEQQNKRFFDYGSMRVHRTLPFVNSHDTYRPILNAIGNYSKPLGDASGWNTGNELGGNGQHIDSREPRLFAAYASVFAVDGNPTVFFEDLFDVGTTSKRWTHLPGNIVDLPVREDIANLIRAHGKLAFKNGSYGVLTGLSGNSAPFYSKGSAGDHIVFERYGRAIIGVSDQYSTVDNNTQDQEVWVSVSDPSWRGRELIDYSGAHGTSTTQVNADGRVLIKTAPAGHNINNARGHGYSIWAPIPNGVTFNQVNDIYNYLMTYSPGRSATTVQEWEMADDLGDSHPASLQQGGRLPSNSIAQRTVGRIYAKGGSTVTCLVYPEVNGRSQTFSIFNASGSLVSELTATSSNSAPLTLNYTPPTSQWLTMRIRNANSNTNAMRAWVNVTYTGPQEVDTRNTPGNLRVSIDEPIELNFDGHLSEASADISPNPGAGNFQFSFTGVEADKTIQCSVWDAKGKQVFLFEEHLDMIQTQFNKQFSALSSGMYLVRLQGGNLNSMVRLVKEH